MDIKKLAPWNWFKDEDASQARSLPVVRSNQQEFYPLGQLHQDIDRIFEGFFRSFGFPSFGLGDVGMFNLKKTLQLKPSVDVAATEKEYSITVEVAGVDEKDITLELLNNSLIIRGEKKQEAQRSDKEYYRIERSYGAFQRVLSLPEDADSESINAQFRNGVLTITLPRKAESKPHGKVIEIKRAA